MKVGVVGAGHIARALAAGWARPGVVPCPDLVFYDVRGDVAVRVAAESGAQTAADLDALVAAADVVIVAVRPQHVLEVVSQVALGLGDRPLVSVAAGVGLARIGAALPPGARAGRVMPNVAAALGLGTFVMAPGTLGECEEQVEDLFALCGDVVKIPEELFDVATVVAGCTPGILAQIVAEMATIGADGGLAPEVAVRLVVASFHGAAAVIAETEDPAAVLRSAATPGGMTAAAIAALEEHELAAALRSAVLAAARRAAELGAA